MSENKLVEKTRQVMKTQNELSELINELKTEVKKVYYENEKLTKENELLKSKVEFLGVSEEFEEEYVKVESPSTPDIPEEIIKQPIETEVEQQKEIVIQEIEIAKKEPSKRNAILLEFFLGQNIIAKIASVLIFLGILSFGQIAYEWMPDLGRVLLIMFGGFVFGGIAYYTEKKELIIFSNVFYGLGIFIIYYSLILAKFGFDLISGSILSYLLAVLMVGVFYFFKNRRYEFLDSVLYTFYIVLGLTMLAHFEPLGGFSQYFEIILFVGLIGVISYIYLVVFYKDKNNMQLIFMSIFFLSIIIYLLGVSLSLVYEEEYLINQMKTALMGYNLFLYSALAIYFVYMINYFIKIDESNRFRALMPFYTIAILSVSSLSLLYFVDIAFGISNGSFSVLLFVIITAPLYTYLYIENKEGEDNFSETYLMIIAIALLIYSFTAGALGKESPSEFTVLNIIMGLEVLLFYILAKFTKDKTHRAIGIIFILIFILRNINFYSYTGSFLFEDSGVIFVSMSLGLILVGIHELFKRLKLDDNQLDNVIAHSTNLLLLIPVVVTLTNDLISDDLAYIFTTVVVLLIGYRWFVGMKIFNLQYKNYIFNGINLGIIGTTLFLNSFYFDHNYKVLEDVFKFWILFVINGYVVLSIKEIYVEYIKGEVNKEQGFIIAYLAGVLVHSIFIHNYINLEFDRVILSSYFLIASAIAVLLGFKQNWSNTRKLGLAAIYFSLAKFFIYDLYSRDFSTFTKMITYFILGFVLLGIALLYAYLEKTYGKTNRQIE
ncbi:MAG: hypothetical protein KQ78_01439 [Candidatus Izimaplasma bacterium HR2]|nr:MAG: hypothetical protein KQ78_01439 [Candidatus Izimaplasma bacterium HR2]